MQTNKFAYLLLITYYLLLINYYLLLKLNANKPIHLLKSDRFGE
jgi:hypothetical protein